MAVGMHGGGVMHDRWCAWRGGGLRDRRDSHCSGRYASYWNAFLLYSLCSTQIVSVFLQFANLGITQRGGWAISVKRHEI